MKRLRLLIFVWLMFVPLGCENESSESIPQAMQAAGIKDRQIIHEHELEDVVLVFYQEPTGGLDAGLVNKTGTGYKWGFGGGTAYEKDDVPWVWTNLDLNSRDKRYQMYYGIVKDHNITRLHIKHNHDGLSAINKDAEIVPTQDYRIWFALQDRYSDIHPGFLLTGYSKEGEEIFRYP
ncbi:hypothetical protein N6H14_05045 [Paenibacillus sp. CC-CFT747]|nr:hypothetical protein N6H14_05045 [Paenibacillus sp. CC-CFT747]